MNQDQAEAEKIAPIATSPLDSCRGRGKKRRTKCATMSERVHRDSIGSDISITKIVIKLTPECSYTVGITHVK